jgi:tetratricopeptide (TPR) repeat protein
MREPKPALSCVLALFACISAAHGQSANGHHELLLQYEGVIGADTTNYEALWRAAAIAVELGEFNPDTHQRDTLFKQAEQYARRAVAADPRDAEGHFQLARALGRTALTLGVRARAKYAVEVREEALAALASNPQHAGALHVVGLWHQNVMQLGKLERLAAKLFLGAKIFGKASWAEAQQSLEQAVAIEPNRIAHRLDLGRLYAARKQYDRAREQLQWVLAAPPADYNDEHYKREAAEALREIPTAKENRHL